jgi:serine/threonine protein kinase
MVAREQYSYEVDFWALGVLLFEMLSGETPFLRKSRSRVMEAIAGSKPDWSRIKDDGAISLLTGLLEKEPGKRIGFRKMREHPWFEDMDWTKVYRKEYSPVFVPPSDGGRPVNFDQEFTTELPTDSYVRPACEDFPGFSFTPETPLDGFN